MLGMNLPRCYERYERSYVMGPAIGAFCTLLYLAGHGGVDEPSVDLKSGKCWSLFPGGRSA